MKNSCSWIPDKIYKEFLKNMPVCTVDVLLFDEKNEKILLFKRKNKPAKGYYYSLGGRLWKNKDFDEMAKIQIKKEIGIKINKKKLFGGMVMSEKFKDSIFSGVSTHTINIFFGYNLSKEEEKRIILDGQHEKGGWLKKDDKLIHPFVKEKIKRLMEKRD